MKSLSSSRVSKFGVLMALGGLSVTTLSFPDTAVAQEACVRTSTGNVVCGTPVAKPSSSRTQSDNNETLQTAVYGSVTWELKSCARKQKKVSCLFSVSSSEDVGYGMYIVNTRMVDADGTSYYASLLQVGTKKITTGGERIFNYMAKGARYKTIMEFTDVPPSVSQIVLLDIYNGTNQNTKFRDIPIN